MRPTSRDLRTAPTDGRSGVRGGTPSLRAFAACLALAACGADPMTPPPASTGIETAPLTVKQVQWNAKQTMVGKVAAVCEQGEDVQVFGDQGLMVFTSGLMLGADPGVRAFSAAAVIPAGDLLGDWVVAVGGDGRVLRLRNRTQLEDVSDRYGLKGAMVREVASLGKGLVAFSLDGKLAVADGKTVTRYDEKLTGLVGGGGRAAGIADGGVRVLDPAARMARLYPLANVTGVAFDAAGKLVVTTRQALYLEDKGGVLERIYESKDAPLHGAAAAGAGVWIGIGDRLGLLGGGKLKRTATGLVPADARLVGSASGDVWVLAGGALQRFGEDSGAGPDEILWKASVLPIFTRTCSLCHLPGGVSGIDLSTYATWSARRALIEQRVLEGRPTPMPPAGAGQLTPADRDAISAWVQSDKK